MSKDKDITPFNDKGQPHGYWEMSWANGILSDKCFYLNGIQIGYEEYSIGGKLTKKKYHL